MNLSHLICKADNLKETVSLFESMGFETEYGQKDNPYNAVIYFPDHTYLEIMEKIHISGVVSFLLRLFGMRDYLNSSLAQNKLPEGFFRFALTMEPSDKKMLSARYKKLFPVSTFFAPVSRTDLHGNKLSCKCLMPSDCSLPFFMTDFNCEKLWQRKHPNGVTGLQKVVYEASDRELEFFRGFPVDKRLDLRPGSRGLVRIEFSRPGNGPLVLEKQDGRWVRSAD